MKKQIKSICFILLLIIILIITLTFGISKNNQLLARDEKEYNDFIKEDSSHNSNNINFYNKLSTNKDVNILILGDELVLGKGQSNNYLGWHNLLGTWIESTYNSHPYIHSIAESGATINDANKLLSPDINIKDYDLIITCFGSNDSRTSLPINNFIESYGNLIKELTIKNPNCTILNILPNTLPIGNPYRSEIQNMSKYNTLITVDVLNEFTTAKTQTPLVTDNLPNDNGYDLYTLSFKKIIENEVKRLNTK